ARLGLRHVNPSVTAFGKVQAGLLQHLLNFLFRDTVIVDVRQASRWIVPKAQFHAATFRRHLPISLARSASAFHPHWVGQPGVRQPGRPWANGIWVWGYDEGRQGVALPRRAMKRIALLPQANSTVAANRLATAAGGQSGQ